jgi:long-chain acyl-CoA synthetase
MSATIVEMFRAQIEAGADRPAMRTKANGEWIARTWHDWDETSLAIAAGLIELGVRAADRVAIFSGTRREWAEIDLAILRAGAVTVPLYQQTTPANAAHVLSDAECTVVFAEDPIQLEKLFRPEVRERLKNVRRVIYLDARRRLERPDANGRLEVRLEDAVPRSERAAVMSLGELLEAGRRVLDRDGTRVSKRAEAVTPDSLASIVYTSGTSGIAKGVCLTHGNFAFECEQVSELLGLTAADEQLLFLPLAHIFARVLMVGAIRTGMVTAFASSPTTALDEANEVHPTFIAAVPRVFERVYAGVQRRMQEESPFRRRAASLAIDVGRKVSALRREGREPGRLLAAQYRAANAAVLERVRRQFGRRLRIAVSGAAALPRAIAEWFEACGVTIYEGYGLTETTAATHINVPGAVRFGTVGRALPGVETKIADDGEILVRGGNVMRGYFRDAESTDAAIDRDGWLHTGDVGAIDADGYLTITDRKKDLIVTAGGKNVAPQWIESMLRSQPWISQAVVLGEGKPYLVALITLDEPTARAWATAAGKDLAWDELLRDRGALEHVRRAVAAANAGLEPFQQIRRWEIVPKDFSLEAGELTDNLKLRRAAIASRYAREIEQLYREA